MFDRILIAVDGSPYSAPAVSAATEIATKFNSHAFVLHVREHDRGRAGAFPLETPQEALDLVSATSRPFVPPASPRWAMRTGQSPGRLPKTSWTPPGAREST